MKTRSPERDKAFKLYQKSGKIMKNGEIADKLGVSTSLVAKWKSQDKWDAIDELPKRKPNGKKSNGKKKGGQKGNINALGSGAPLGNTNALKHGGYSAVYWDTIDDEEKSLINDMPKDEEELLIEQIRLYTIRERRIMKAITYVREQKGDQVLAYATRSEDKRTFDGKDDEEKERQKELYNSKIKEKVASGERLPGNTYHISTSTENKQSVISRLEAELTKIQRAKNQAIDSLSKLNIEKQKLELLRDGNNVEIEDTTETDVMLYEQDLSSEENHSV